jgi:transposase
VGIDLGLASFLMTDAGKPVEHPQPLRDAQARLRRAQRSLARKKCGSYRRTKQRRHVARLHEKIVNVRRDFQHQTRAQAGRGLRRGLSRKPGDQKHGAQPLPGPEHR